MLRSSDETGAPEGAQVPEMQSSPSVPVVSDFCANRSGSQISTFDITVWHDQCPDRYMFVKILREYCKKFAYQLEAGSENGTLHWQCRVSLIVKRRLHEFQSVFPIKFPHAKVSITSKDVHKGQNFNYAMKGDTRVEGPWTDKDDSEPPFMSNGLRRFLTYHKYSWQETLQEMLESMIAAMDDRSIICVIDTFGNSGKSMFCKYLAYKQIALSLPTMVSMEDMLQFCMSQPPAKAYLVDMPRALKKEKLHQFWSGIEQLKNGYLYDKRYTGRVKQIDEPQIVVFTNFPPDLSALSPDRWKMYAMTADRALIPYTTSMFV